MSVKKSAQIRPISVIRVRFLPNLELLKIRFVDSLTLCYAGRAETNRPVKRRLKATNYKQGSGGTQIIFCSSTRLWVATTDFE
jgi:hypothetical protein